MCVNTNIQKCFNKRKTIQSYTFISINANIRKHSSLTHDKNKTLKNYNFINIKYKYVKQNTFMLR